MKAKGKNNTSDKKILKFVIIIFLIWYLLLQIIAGQNIIEEKQHPNLPLYHTTYWAKWDAQHYLDIAINGYNKLKTVFFPLYPQLIRIFFRLNFNPFWVGHLLSSAFLITALYFFYKIIIIDFSDHTAKWSIIFLLLYPSSFFFISFYPASLLFLLTVSSLYYARQKKWLLASTLAFFGCLTKFSGIILLPVLLIEYLNQINFKWEEIKKNILLPLLSLLGTFIYSLFLYLNFNNAFLFLTNQHKWESHILLPHSTLYNYILRIIETWQNFEYNTSISLFIILVCFFIILLITSQKIKKIRFSYLILTASIITYPFFGIFFSLNRFLLSAFPVFIMMALIKRKSIKYTLIIILSLFLIININFFINGYWAG